MQNGASIPQEAGTTVLEVKKTSRSTFKTRVEESLPPLTMYLLPAQPARSLVF